MPPLEGDKEEVKEKKKRLKILTPSKLLTKLQASVLLAQIKAGNNPYQLKNEIK